MKAIVQDRYGSADVLEIRDLEKPRPDDDELLGLDIERFSSESRQHKGANRVAEDVNSADLSVVSGTPTFFINGRRHYGAYDIATLSATVRAARATVATTRPST